jgi:hypothetical protein
MMNEDQPDYKLGHLNNMLISLNIGFAITSSLFIYEGAQHIAEAPTLIRQCLESFAKFLAHIASLVVSGRTRVEYLHSVFIRELIFLGLTVGLAILVYSSIVPLMRRYGYRLLFTLVWGVLALFAVPSCWLYIVHATWSIYEPKPFGETYGLASAVEFIAVGVLVYIVRRQPVWHGAIVFGLHYVFWMLLMLRHMFSPLMGLALSLAFPASNLIWLLHAQALQWRNTEIST